MIPKGVRGNKRSRSEIGKIKKRIRTMMYSEDPYTDEEMLDKLKLPESTFYRYKAQIWNEDAASIKEPYLKEIAKGEVHANTIKKDFTSREKVAIKKAMEPVEKEAAKERKKRKVCSEESSEQKGETREKVAAFVDTSFDTLNKLKHIVKVEVFKDPSPKPQVMKL